MSTPLTPSKRPHDRSPSEPNGKRNLQKSDQSKILPGGIVFRVLCPASKTGSVIGKGGTIISQIRQETGAKVKVEEAVPGCDERVVVIMGSESSDKETEVGTEQRKEDVGEEATAANHSDEEKENGENNDDKFSDPVKDLKSVKETSNVQKALLLVFERIMEGPDSDGVDGETVKSFMMVLRLLVLSSQVGCLFGKGGSVIKQMSAESGAQIRILPRDKLPSCASASDELVQITGEVDAVRKALQSVSQQLIENPPRDHDSFTLNTTGQSSHSFGPRPEVYPPPNHFFSSQGAPFAAGPRDVEIHSPLPPHIPGRMMPSLEMLTFRLLCPDEKVGGVIGKGGAIIKTLQQEAGCEIKVLEAIPDSEDRIIVISGPVHPDDRISAAQDAVLRVLSRINRAIPDSKDKTMMARLLVSSNQIGCLLGKGGAIIAEMRKSSGAHIRILGKDQVPKCASEGEEVVQINGEQDTVRDALLQITTRLRHHFFRDAFPSIYHPPNPAFLDQVPPFPSFRGRREFSPPGVGPFHHFDAFGGPPPHGGFHPNDDPLFMRNIHRPGMPPHISERKPWGPQGFIGMPDFAGPPHRRISGFGGGSQPAIITSTTVEVVVPRSLVPIIYGEDGACLKQIRQISDAKITITEPQPAATETAIIISGTPEQTHAAQSLIQAFVMSETESA
ncbi:KH domain-containing protein HEN4-like isoform X2 [Durio zibethinus]|uniref:KH domain-containing protein HEN4-like isoform X2 n=1 Tax=Durio zibethinus TaxID=66656 RepID=A0A6P6B7U6_DURZI|nr:KH domain-containing protein HEN4-like isoform X2 [Durio zibethinus]